MGYTKVVRSGDVVEVFEYERDLPQRSLKRAKSRHGGLKRWWRSSANAKRCSIAFKRLVRSTVFALGTPWLLTLTMLDICTISEAYRAYTDFFKSFQRRYGKVVAIAVPEFQKRGAVHFHVLLWGVAETDLSDERNSRRIQRFWGLGYVDVIRTDGSPLLAGYLAKYMSKAMLDDRLMGKRAYTSTRGVVRPVSIGSKTPVALDWAREEWGLKDNSVDKPSLQQDRVFSTMWLGRAHYQRYLIPKSP